MQTIDVATPGRPLHHPYLTSFRFLIVWCIVHASIEQSEFPVSKWATYERYRHHLLLLENVKGVKKMMWASCFCIDPDGTPTFRIQIGLLQVFNPNYYGVGE
jgi:hypothetical protein